MGRQRQIASLGAPKSNGGFYSHVAIELASDRPSLTPSVILEGLINYACEAVDLGCSSPTLDKLAGMGCDVLL